MLLDSVKARKLQRTEGIQSSPFFFFFFKKLIIERVEKTNERNLDD